MFVAAMITASASDTIRDSLVSAVIRRGRITRTATNSAASNTGISRREPSSND